MSETGPTHEPKPLRNLRLKPPEQLHAQAEAYAETLKDLRDQAALVPLMEELSTIGSLNQLDELDPALRALVEQDRADYVKFLQQHQGDPGYQADLTERIEAYRRYQEFKPRVRELQAQVDIIVRQFSAEDFEAQYHETRNAVYQQVAELPGFVELSPNSAVFQLYPANDRNEPTPPGSQQQMLVKFPLWRTAPVPDERTRLWLLLKFYQHLVAMRRMTGVSHVAQVRAYSPSDLALVVEAAPGRQMSLGPDERGDQLATEHLHQLVDLAVGTVERGIILDSLPDNFFLDPDSAGITLIDCDPYEMLDLDTQLALSPEEARQEAPPVWPIDNPEWRANQIAAKVSELVFPILTYRHGGYPPMSRAERFQQIYEGGGFGGGSRITFWDPEEEVTVTRELETILAERHPVIWERIERQRHAAAVALETHRSTLGYKLNLALRESRNS